MNQKQITLDVREDIRAGREPFSRIMSAVATLPTDGELLLIAPFEPTPLFSVLRQRGFSHASHQTESGDFEVLFTRGSAAPLNTGKPAVAKRADGITPAEARRPNSRPDAGSTPAQILVVDARGLEPPQPLVKILEAVAALPAESELHGLTDRRPMHLYPQLEERGFAAETEEQSDGSFRTRIYRR